MNCVLVKSKPEFLLQLTFITYVIRDVLHVYFQSFL